LRFLLRRRIAAQNVVESVEVPGPKRFKLVQPPGCILQVGGFQSCGAALPIYSALNKPRAFQDFQVFGDGRLAHTKWSGKLPDSCFAIC
jgi:hypothetical protein